MSKTENFDNFDGKRQGSLIIEGNTLRINKNRQLRFNCEVEICEYEKRAKLGLGTKKTKEMRRLFATEIEGASEAAEK